MSDQTNSDIPVREPSVPDALPDEPIDERLYNVEWLAVAEAAHHFGVSQRAIQKRITKGQLVSRREGREWRVRLVTSKWAYESVPSTPDEPVRELSEPNAPLEEPVREPSSSEDTALLEQMQSEIAHLREQLQVKDAQLNDGRVAESELRRLMLADKHELNALREQVKMLAAPPVEVETANLTKPDLIEETPVEEHVQDAPAPHSAKESTETVNRTLGAETGIQRPSGRKWFEFWKR